MVDGEGNLNLGFSGENEEADPVLRKLLHDVESGSPGSQKPVGADILGEHASRNIDAEQNIASFVFCFDPFFT